ncbi:Glycosyl phosphatidyl inositol anchor synthesis [Coemansia sp. RSA 1813]|nr:Glycosyl phosphatidyl inositol anchor synthesis [Coemansia sp. RSA 1646]KAJ1769122.1 Glycosyl phosphatidyl inositol anchor synthesis [Coemansia sp. RSA 1843]KAJ2091925.1 Glycosyl phosphatidyl inositol anchor synthesis [Coemansia sp. RSA 986]KAJ2212450.1 Glycosyl phosphatidyl inositol anchor synthesis [Coemansia sp. RSA 487]KAJ2571680.1 Glycosyl phosphatidyl inositol anchor synthesis [Coemansia sp. RSA 1813]
MIPASRNGLLLIGVLFHLIYLLSIFDIYFRSPLVHGMTPHRVNLKAPAKRLVLFVADGLRADKIYGPHNNQTSGNKEELAPFLLNKLRAEGSWGVSHTRMPTESRPGHVAAIAGFYEDVSAVTKGWKMNPVEFDSVFNESRHTWSFGSPDILLMFAHGASDKSRVDTYMYPQEYEDFSGNGDRLDTWVFKRADKFFESASISGSELHRAMHSDQIVFFFHLLGIDTNGHGFKPYSEEYLNNIRLVDRGIERLVSQFETYYGNDAQTAYVFTADHGMNDRGAHGDGHPDNTRTPLIAWGAGVSKPAEAPPGQVAPGHDAFSSSWGLDRFQRKDVNQADIAPLMAALVGLNFPLNSVGTLPLGYIDAGDEFNANAALVNALQVLEQYRVKHDQKKKTEMFFQPYAPMHEPDNTPEHALARTRRLIDSRRYKDAEAECLQLIARCLEGLRYFQRYDWLLLRSIVSMGYLGWIAYSLLFIFRSYVLPAPSGPRQQLHAASSYRSKSARAIGILGLLVFALFAAMFYRQKSPAMYYAYVAFPVYFWTETLQQAPLMQQISANYLRMSVRWRPLAFVLGYVAVLEALVYAYFDRRVYTAAFMLLAVFWPLTVSAKFRRKHMGLLSLWTLFCMLTSVFTLLPVERNDHLGLVIVGGLLIAASGSYAWHRSRAFVLPPPGVSAKRAHNAIALDRLIILVEVLLVAAATVLGPATSKATQERGYLPRHYQLGCWAILVVSTLLPLLHGSKLNNGARDQHYLYRLVTIYVAFAAPFVLLTVSYESIFYFAYSVVLLLWLAIERALYQERAEDRLFAPTEQTRLSRLSSVRAGDGVLGLGRTLELSDMRTGIMFLFFVNVAFFGTGNVASLASFSLDSVYRLITVFDPFMMTALLLFKIFIPFFLVSAVFGVLNRSLELPPFSLFLFVLSTTDVMTVNFFFLVRDDGSWLDIGMSISHFCISGLFVLFAIVLFVLSHALVGRVLIPGTAVNAKPPQKQR